MIKSYVTTTMAFVDNVGSEVYRFYHVVDLSCVDSWRNRRSPINAACPFETGRMTCFGQKSTGQKGKYSSRLSCRKLAHPTFPQRAVP